MDALQLLEQKVNSLVSLTKKLQNQNKQLDTTRRTHEDTLNALRTEKELLMAENEQLKSSLSLLKKETEQETFLVRGLEKEKNESTALVDKLIKHIDSIVIRESQQ